MNPSTAHHIARKGIVLTGAPASAGHMPGGAGVPTPWGIQLAGGVPARGGHVPLAAGVPG
ncbi:MAG: hypothetical protein ACYDEN_00910 [Acidimicrobiales bacterium]